MKQKSRTAQALGTRLARGRQAVQPGPVQQNTNTHTHQKWVQRNTKEPEKKKKDMKKSEKKNEGRV